MANDANTVSKVPYLQYQFIFKPFDDQGNSPRVNLEEKLDKIATYHSALQSGSDVPLQVENCIPINPAFGSGAYTHCPLTIRVEDFTSRKIPLAFDVPHYAQTLHVILKAEHVQDDIYSLRTPERTFYIQLTKHDAEKAARMRSDENTVDAITRQINTDIRAAESVIGSVQFAGCDFGFGINDGPVGSVQGEAGSLRNELYDLPKVLAGGIIPIKAPYVVPEFKETDWKLAPNQRAGIELYNQLKAEIQKE